MKNTSHFFLLPGDVRRARMDAASSLIGHFRAADEVGLGIEWFDLFIKHLSEQIAAQCASFDSEEAANQAGKDLNV